MTSALGRASLNLTLWLETDQHPWSGVQRANGGCFLFREKILNGRSFQGLVRSVSK